MPGPKKRVVYRGAIFNIEEWKLPKTGTTFARITGPGAVAVLPILDDGRILLERQYRHPLGKYLYEIPAGHINSGEAPMHTAKRELAEETGYIAGRLTRLFGIYEAPGSLTQFLHIYLARNLEKKKAHTERDEIITLSKVSLEKALSMIRSNRIRDAKTICGILYYSCFVRK